MMYNEELVALGAFAAYTVAGSWIGTAGSVFLLVKLDEETVSKFGKVTIPMVLPAIARVVYSGEYGPAAIIAGTASIFGAVSGAALVAWMSYTNNSTKKDS